jgi:2-methylcitrate dehydratase PrpD
MMSSEQDRIAAALADFALALKPAAIPEAVAERARLLILDGAGVALAAASRGMDRPFAEALRIAGGDGAHRVIGRRDLWSMRDAAFLNGMLIHAIEYDDTHMEAVLHPTATTLPAALAAAEHAGASDEDLLAAYVAGVEVSARLGALAPGRFQASGFHPTGVIGCFAAAVAAGRLLRLDRRQMISAFGIALSTAAGSMQFLQGGGIGKRLHAGWAAQSGLTAALLASRDLDGARLPFTGRHGLFESFARISPDADMVEARLGDLGRDWETLAVAIKPYPAAFYSHGCIEAAIHLATVHDLAVPDIAAVEAVVPPAVLSKLAEPHAAKAAPMSVAEAQFALPFLVASALAARRFGLPQLEQENLADPGTRALARLVTCRGDAGMDFPRVYSGGVTVICRDGRQLSHRVDVNLGAMERPVGAPFILAKFSDNLGRSDRSLLGRIGTIVAPML